MLSVKEFPNSLSFSVASRQTQNVTMLSYVMSVQFQDMQKNGPMHQENAIFHGISMARVTLVFA